MFCTDKERQNCDVEKRECEGCYYNKEVPTPDNPIPIEKQTQIIELERRDVQSEIRYWNKKYIDTLLELVKEKEKNKKLVDKCKELIKEKQELTTICEESIPEHQMEEAKRVIDMMAEDLPDNNYEFGCYYENDAECMHGPARNCKECIKEYYFKKARGKKNDSKK